MDQVTRLCYVEDVERDGQRAKVFQVLEGHFADPELSIAVALAHTPRRVPLRECGAAAEAEVVQALRPALAPDQRQLIVLDLQAFPFLVAYVDARDQRQVNADESQFSKDIVQLWEGYDQAAEVPLIITNPDTGFCGLKRIPLAQA